MNLLLPIFSRRCLLLALLLFLFIGAFSHRAAQAQFTAFGQLSTEIIDDGVTFVVTVRLRTDPGINLGSSNVAFTFNADGLDFPFDPVKDTDYVYLAYDGEQGPSSYQSTVTRTGDEVSVNIGLVTLFNGAPVPTSLVDVVKIFFTITDPAQTSQLAWSFTEVLADDFSEASSYHFIGEEGVLPVELVVFKAQSDGEAALLHWQTASETNNAGFEIQHRPALPNPQSPIPNWETLGFVEGHGTTGEAQSYRFRIEALEPGVHTFRLKQIDYDGTYDFSPEVEVQVELSTTYRLTTPYPNPFNSQVRFSLMVRRQQHIEVAVYDALGRQVQTLFDGVLRAESAQSFVFGSEGLQSGVYFIRAVGKTFVATRRAMLIK